MSTLAGWSGTHLEGDGVLKRMAEVLSGPAPLVESHRADDFAVTTVRPSVAGGGSYIAATPEGDIVLAFSGYLHSEEPAVQRNPAPYCLELYQTHGATFGNELSGSFAIAIRDGRSGHLLLITDRIGTRPLYYSTQQDFVFGSEVKAILQYPGISRKLNPDRLREFLVIACLPGWVTYYDHILQVPTASVLAWDGETVQVSRYWEPRFEWDPRADIRELAETAVQALRGSVRRSCIARERPGLMLSGGLDSRAIAATAERPPLCITMHREDCYEVRTARQVADALGFKHVFVRLDSTFPLELLQSGALIGDGMHPYANAQALAIEGTLREHAVDCLLNGWSMDVHYSGMCLPAKSIRLAVTDVPIPLLAPLDAGELAPRFVKQHQTERTGSLGIVLQGTSAPEVLHAVTGRVQGIVDELGRTVRDPYDATDWLELLGNSARQRDFLNVLAIDRLVPAAIPAHDTEMMECLLRLPPAYRFGQRIYLRMYHLLDPRLRRIDYTSLGGPLSGSVWWNWWRQQLRETHRDVIDAGLRRLLHLGPSTRYQGSWPQAGSAMRRCPQWHEALRQCLASSRLVDLGIVSRAGLSQAIEEHLRRVRNHADLLSAWLTLEAWLETQG